MLYLLLICLFITIVYNTFIIIKYKTIPTSLSETNYMLGGLKRYFFTAYCATTCFLIVPALMAYTSENFQFLPFIFCGGLLFAGCTPFFKEDIQKKAHYISAYVAFAAFIIYLILCMHWIWIVEYILILGALCIWKFKSLVYFAEILALLLLLTNFFMKILC